VLQRVCLVNPQSASVHCHIAVRSYYNLACCTLHSSKQIPSFRRNRQGRPEGGGSTFIRNLCIHHPDVPIVTTDITIRNPKLYITVLIGFRSFQALAGLNKQPPAVHVQVTVHRDNLRIDNQQDASSIQNVILSRNSTCFGHLLCPSSGVVSCTRGNLHVSCRLCGRCLGESGWNSATCTTDNS
jgi:hypothetical protein